MIEWPGKREARPIETRPMVNTGSLELGMAKQIFQQIFHTRPSEVEDMIHRRLTLQY